MPVGQIAFIEGDRTPPSAPENNDHSPPQAHPPHPNMHVASSGDDDVEDPRDREFNHDRHPDLEVYLIWKNNCKNTFKNYQRFEEEYWDDLFGRVFRESQGHSRFRVAEMCD
jgi:hypothetical protein